MKKLARKPNVELWCESYYSSLKGDTVMFYYGLNNKDGKLRKYAKVKDIKDEWWLLNEKEFKIENRANTFIEIMKYFGKFYTIETSF